MATVTLKQSAGDYSTLASAMSSRSGDGDIISIEGTWSVDDTTVCTNSFATTVTTDTDSANPGYIPGSPTHYRLRNTSGHSITLTDNLVMTGVDVGSQSTGVSDELFRCSSGISALTLDKCILWFDSRTDQQDIVYTDIAGLTVSLENCAAWNVYRAVFDSFDQDGTNTFNSNCCSFYDVGNSITEGSRSGIVGVGQSANSPVVDVNIFNTKIHINTGAAINHASSSGGTVTSDQIISSTTAGDHLTGGSTTENTTNATWSAIWTAGTPSTGTYVAVNDITGGPMDLRLQDHADNDAQDAHTDASGAGLSMPVDDVVGTSRPQNTNYDMGFFEVVLAVGGEPMPSFTPNMQRTVRTRFM